MDGELAPHMDEHPVALAIIILSPKSWVRSLTYGVSPHPGQAPLNSKSGLTSWLPFKVLRSNKLSFWVTVIANSQLSPVFLFALPQAS